MTIKEIEQLSQLDRATIRFYERENLIKPNRQENGYRDYSEDDLQMLLRIKLLRSLQISLEEIKALLKGTSELSDVLAKQIQKLDQDKQDISYALQVCQIMQEENVTMEALDARQYLEEIRSRNTEKGKHNLTYQEDRLPIVVHPWRRFFARMFDLFLYRTLWDAMLILLFRINIAANTAGENFFASYIAIVILLFAEPALLSRFRTTLGKAVFGLQVEQADGRNLTYGEAFSRTWQVIGKGFGYNIPFYSLWRLWKSYGVCSYKLTQPWDESTNYTIKDTKTYRTALMIASYVIVQIFSLVVASSLLLPPNRGNLTIAQFAENYNYYSNYTGADFSDKFLDNDAKWRDKAFDGIVYKQFGYTQMPEFHFTLQNGFIKQVSFVVELENSQEWLGSYQTHMLLTSLSLIGAQEEMNLLSSIPNRVVKIIDKHLFQNYQFTEADVHITSSITYSGYLQAQVGVLIPEEDNQSTYFKLTYSAQPNDD